VSSLPQSLSEYNRYLSLPTIQKLNFESTTANSWERNYTLYFLDPLISQEAKDKQFEILEKEHGIQKEWFNDVQWDPKYEIGSAGEPDINPK